MRFAQLVIGPAGSGKSTYCATVVKYCEDSRRRVNVVNLDPAAEHFDYEPYIDIRELIHLDDAMEDTDLEFGPNGGLVFCLEYLIENFKWLEDRLEEDTDDYILFDCPGQVELYTHLNIMQQLTENLKRLDFNICGVYIIDSKFMVEPSMFMSGVMTALSSMMSLEIPHVNVLSKIDLLDKHARMEIERFLEPNVHLLLDEEVSSYQMRRWRKKYHKLNKVIAGLIDDYSIVKFVPLNKEDTESIGDLLIVIDNAIQYGDDLDVKMKFPEEQEEEDIE